MRKLGKKMHYLKESIEAYCTCASCSCYCGACYCGCSCSIGLLYSGVAISTASSGISNVNNSNQQSVFASNYGPNFTV